MNSTDTETEPTERLESPTTAPSKARKSKAAKSKTRKAKPSKSRTSSRKTATSTRRKPSKAKATKAKRKTGNAADRKAKGTHLLVIRCEVALVNKMRKLTAANAKTGKGPVTLNALAVEVLTKRLS